MNKQRVFFILLVLLILFVLITTISCTNRVETGKQITIRNEAIDSITTKTESIIEVQVELIDRIDTIELPAYCGEFMWDMTMKYKVIKVLKGAYQENTILINHKCPREAIENKWIENNKIYAYKLKPRKMLKSISIGQKEWGEMQDAGDYEIVGEQ